MKKIIVSLLFAASAVTCFAQDTNNEDEDKGKFKKENIFIGGSIGLSIGGWSGGFNVGANPEIGYSVAQWLDAGISTNFNYFSFKAENNNGLRQRSTTLGGGVFARIHPIRNFFLQVLPEYNRINTTITDISTTPNSEYKYRQEAPSLLAGIGYGQRVIGGSSFFTVLMFDLGNNLQSPYLDSDGRKLPILRTGFNFYLRPKSQR